MEPKANKKGSLQLGAGNEIASYPSTELLKTRCTALRRETNSVKAVEQFFCHNEYDLPLY